MQIYGIDSRNLGIYDLVIHSDEHTPEEIVQDILDGFADAS